jgi:hypothetical protein
MQRLAEAFEYYILDDNFEPVRVSELRRSLWVDSVHISKICVAETHLIHKSSGNIATTITTYYDGRNRTPAVLCTPYLWETRVAYYYGEENRYQTYQKAKEGHEDKVRSIITLLTKENFIVERRDIEIPTEE